MAEMKLPYADPVERNERQKEKNKYITKNCQNAKKNKKE